MNTFTATIDIIGVNPFVFVPETVLAELFRQAGRNKGPIPVRGTIDGFSYVQTLVKYAGAWRLYINGGMLTGSRRALGDTASLSIEVDPSDRTIPMNPKLASALAQSPEAKAIFDGLAPSLKKEIVRYINNLKTEASIDLNVDRAIQFLLGKSRFIGRDHP